ncbi:MAG: DUF3592 domain-containing protein [Rhodobacteraceae bacterium]|nr:DUF3592 domain-containing protein [Paracoccaceae bacterium]TVR43311.1 MAG: DUF3592 domain-containing protein [Paracoccaceae bacterium]
MSEPRISIMSLLARQRAWLAAIPVIIALIAGGFATYHLSRLLAFDLRGVTATARITDTRVLRRTRSSSDGTSRTRRSYQIDYQFEAQGGALQSGTARVSSWFYSDVSTGDEVPITYLPDAPEHVLMDRFNQLGAVFLFGVPALISLAVALYAVGRYGRRTRAMLRAGYDGSRRKATVIDHLPSKGKRGDEPMSWRLHWRDTVGDEGESLSQGGRVLQYSVPRGTEITVHLDPVTGQAFWQRDIFGN